MIRNINKHLDTRLNYDIPLMYCGIDIHKHQVTIAIYGRDRNQLEFCKSEVFKTDPAGLNAMWVFSQRYSPQGYAMEATGIYHHPVAEFLQRQLERLHLNFDICIVNPADVAGIPGQQQRNDKLDAIQIAKFYAAGLLKKGRSIVPELEDLKALFRMNWRLEHDRTALKNRIHKTLDRAGFRPRKLNLNAEWTLEVLRSLTYHTGVISDFLTQAVLPESSLSQYKTYLMKSLTEWSRFGDIQLSPAQRALIRQDLYELGLKSARETMVKLEIEKGLQNQPILCDQAHRIASIPGITPYSAVWILTELGGIARFPNIRNFLSFCGCVPRSEISAEVTYSTHLTRHSNRYLCMIFYQAAIIVANIVKQDSPLKEYARHAMLQKTGQLKLGYCKIMAKIARMVYGILKNHSSFNENNAAECKLTRKMGLYTIVEQKAILRAQRALSRINTIKGLGEISCEIDTLIRSLEDSLKKKDAEG
jgi:transposase